MQKRMIYLLIAFAVSAALALAPASAQAAAGGNGGGGAGGGGGLPPEVTSNTNRIVVLEQLVTDLQAALAAEISRA